MSSAKSKILVCAHRASWRPAEEPYLPIHVGAALGGEELGIARDDEGDNISSRNPSFCELTALYWAWKNLHGAEYVGLCHYRRYFDFHPDRIEPRPLIVVHGGRPDPTHIRLDDPREALGGADIVLARPTVYPYNLWTDYCLCHVMEDLQTLERIVAERHPDYLNAFRQVVRRNNHLSHYNMFFCRRELFDAYCTWLFDILFEAERRIDITHYSPVQRRIFGYMSERLLNVWVRHNRLKVRYLPVILLDDGAAVRSKFSQWFSGGWKNLKFVISRI